MNKSVTTAVHVYRTPFEADLDAIGVRLNRDSNVVYEERGTPLKQIRFRRPDLDENGEPEF
ncbi:MAG: hypothetical protein AAFX78_02700 [Cyanobacteria bacterium J06638_20]